MDRRKHSPIWTYFSILSFENKIARCEQCGLQMSYRGTITNLKSHLTKKHPTIDLTLQCQQKKIQVPVSNLQNNYNELCPTNKLRDGGNVEGLTLNMTNSEPQPGCSSKQSNNYNNNTQSKISTFLPQKISVSQKKIIDKHLVQLFTQDYQPFSIVQDTGFKSFVKSLNPSYELPSRKVISHNLIPAAYETCKTQLLQKLQNIKRVCLTTDCWSSSTNESYLALTAHFVSDFKLESVLLECKPTEGSHTSVHLAESIKQITDSYGLSDKVLIVVSDNAANIVAAVNELNWKHFGCYAHKINLIVRGALDLVKELLEKARQIVTFFKRSNLATEKLMKYQKDSAENNIPKKLIQDVPTRWNASFYMLQRLVLLQDAVKTSLALSDKASLNLNANEWKLCSQLVEVLEPFEGVTRQMSGQKYVTGSQIIVLTFGISNVCSVLIKKPYNQEIIQVIQELQNGINNRFKNIEYSKTAGICTFLDPRFKLLPFTSEAATKTLKDTVTKLVTNQLNKERKLQNPEEDIQEPKTKKQKTDGLSVWAFFDNIKEKLPETNATSSAIIEIQRYLEEPVIDRQEDPLRWWLSNHHHYPYLAKLVNEHFAMVATSVPCESVFSKAGIIINDRRTRLKSSKVQQLTFLKANAFV